MGYTHYWRNNGIETKNWEKAMELSKLIVAYHATPLLAGGDGTGKPQLAPDICFNGKASEDEDHETFYLPEDPDSMGDEFCKTNQEPYDVVVIAVLCTLKHCCKNQITISSDGEPSEWKEGVLLARKATHKTIDLPNTPEEWAEEWVDSYKPSIIADYHATMEALNA